MGLLEFFSRSPQEREAGRIIQELERTRLSRGRPRLKPQEQIQYDEARRMQRRYFLRLAATGVLGGAVAVGAMGILQIKKKRGAPIERDAPLEYNERENGEFFPSLEIGRKTYDEGFLKVLENIPEKPVSTEPFEIEGLRNLRLFRRNLVRWAEIRGNGQLFALEQGLKEGAWMVMLPKDHPDVSYENPLLSIDPDPNPPDTNLLRILPYRISKTWAGIGLSHELMHLYDRVSRYEPLKPNREQFLMGEVRAYAIEMDVTDLFTLGRFGRTLSEILEGKTFRSPEEISRFILDRRNLIPLAQRLDSVIDSTQASSRAERGLRDGFYTMAFGLHYIKQNYPPEAGIPFMMRYIEVVMGPSSVPQH